MKSQVMTNRKKKRQWTRWSLWFRRLLCLRQRVTRS